MIARFTDRREAGTRLAERLRGYRDRPDVVVLGLPRGGVAVAYEVARSLGAPLDLFLVRKVGLPGHEELAIGAVAEGGLEVLNDDLIRSLSLAPPAVEAAVARERERLGAREAFFRHLRRPRPLAGKTVIVVDDGLATGMTMEAAVQTLRTMAPAAIVVAVPVGAAESCARLAARADAVICAEIPPDFAAVGLWYEDFRQVDDAEVTALLRASSLSP